MGVPNISYFIPPEDRPIDYREPQEHKVTRYYILYKHLIPRAHSLGSSFSELVFPLVRTKKLVALEKSFLGGFRIQKITLILKLLVVITPFFKF